MASDERSTSTESLNVDEFEGESLQQFSDKEWDKARPAYSATAINTKSSMHKVTVFTASSTHEFKPPQEKPVDVENVQKRNSKTLYRDSEVVEIIRRVRETLRQHPLVARIDVSVQAEVANLDGRESPELRRFREFRSEDGDDRGGRFLRQ